MIDCGRSALCSAYTAKDLPAKYVEGNYAECESYQKALLERERDKAPKKVGCCTVM
jgi:hypothetical protein